MQKCVAIFFFCLSAYLLKAQEWTLQDIPVYHSFDQFEPILSSNSDTTYLVNFWATWCGPCVKELPYFEDVQKQSEGKPVKVILVSLDFEKQIESRLLPFLNKHEIRSDVVLLLDKKESQWIDRVDPRWSGAIPITIVYKNDKRDFYEKSFHSTEELKEILKPYLTI